MREPSVKKEKHPLVGERSTTSAPPYGSDEGTPTPSLAALVGMVVNGSKKSKYVYKYKDKDAVRFDVTRYSDLTEKIIPFFDKYSICGDKAKDFSLRACAKEQAGF
jgi:hypothetical protein